MHTWRVVPLTQETLPRKKKSSAAPNPLEAVFQMFLNHLQELRLQPESQPSLPGVTPRPISAPFSSLLKISSAQAPQPSILAKGGEGGAAGVPWEAAGVVYKHNLLTTIVLFTSHVCWVSYLCHSVRSPPHLADKYVY